jgi:large subunit ribosomal protein L6
MWGEKISLSFGKKNIMSRLGKQPIEIPSGVTVEVVDGTIKVKGSKGELEKKFPKGVDVKVEGNEVTVSKTSETKESRALWGTFASHIQNMIEGVTEGFKKELEIEGVGYRAEAQGNKIKLNVGFSHPVELEAPQGVEVSVEKSLITVSGIDKEVVGQFAANIRKVKKPEPYKGKGIHYVGEYIIRKQGKKAVA